MNKLFFKVILLVLFFVSLSVKGFATVMVSTSAEDLHFRSLVLDTHIDTTQRLIWESFDLKHQHQKGSIDIPELIGIDPNNDANQNKQALDKWVMIRKIKRIF